MSKMVERVAKAIWLQLSDTPLDHCEDIARAAIEAMREPTRAMEDAADDHNANGIWQAMIYAALREKTDA